MAVESRDAVLCSAGCERAARPSCGPASLRDVRGRLRVGCVCGECVLKSTPGAGDGPPGMRQRRCPRFLHRICFTVSFQPLFLPRPLPEPPLAVLGSLRSPAGGRGRDRAPVFPPSSRAGVVARPGQALPAAPRGRGGTCVPAGCGDTGDLPRQAAAGPEQRGFYLI